jgi:hypothetical protein
LDQQFQDLVAVTQRVISLLCEADEKYWSRGLQRALPLIHQRKLAGATHILGCYGGEQTFSDVVVGEQWRTSDPLRFANVNARLHHQRNELFAAANKITSRDSW